MNLKEEVKEIYNNRPSPEEKKQEREEKKERAAEARKEERERAKEHKVHTGYKILMLVMALVAAALLAAMILVDTFPADLTLTLVLLMIGMYVLTAFLVTRHKRWKRAAGVILSVFFMVIFGAATYYLGTTYAMLSKISGGSFTNAERGEAKIDPTKDPFNLYITGIDQWEKEKGLDLERSDVNMLVTVNPVTKKVLLTSIPRDSYVKLHTAQQMDKLTHTGVYGVDESIDTVQDWLGLDINYYVKMNFSGARDIINAIGGVTVYSPVEFRSSLKGYKYKKGWNKLDGKHAIYFARERKAFEGKDSIRVENQQRVMKAIIKKLTSSTTLLTRYGEVMAAAGNNLHTDMTYDEILALVKMQMSDLAEWDVETQKIEGEYDEDYVASLTQSQKFSVYRTSPASERKCREAIRTVQHPPAEELSMLKDRQKGFLINVVKRLARSGEDEEDVEPIEAWK